VSCIVEQKYSKLAINALHDAFEPAGKAIKKKTTKK
jgi:hypothetical protein